MSKEDFAALIDSYADAKTTKNPHLIRIVGMQLEAALDKIYAKSENDE